MQARNIVIATGGRAFVPSFPGAEHTIISDDVLELKQIPKRMVIVGGGYIGLEFAGVFANLGTEVHVFYRGPLPLTGFDGEVRGLICVSDWLPGFRGLYVVGGMSLQFPQTSAGRMRIGSPMEQRVSGDSAISCCNRPHAASQQTHIT